MAACAWNLKKWLVIATIFCFGKNWVYFCKMPKVFWRHWIKSSFVDLDG
ncbi:hypothetical protein BSPWISOXPB_4757 [uncultured Gammaproteobacteria bacterium]|nr:hypothetical protein BSPWISOXPB_4757 [uncultured Gammaproteobacteria bacterium]